MLVWQNGIAMNVPQKDQRSFACLDNQGTPLPLELQLGKVKEKVVTIYNIESKKRLNMTCAVILKYMPLNL